MIVPDWVTICESRLGGYVLGIPPLLKRFQACVRFFGSQPPCE